MVILRLATVPIYPHRLRPDLAICCLPVEFNKCLDRRPTPFFAAQEPPPNRRSCMYCPLDLLNCEDRNLNSRMAFFNSTIVHQAGIVGR